jgi:hypothetical protein
MSVIFVCTKQFANSFNDGQGLPQPCVVSAFESTVLSVCASHSELLCFCVPCDAVDVLDHSAELCNGDAQRTPEIFYILDGSFVTSTTLHCLYVTFSEYHLQYCNLGLPRPCK